MFEKIGSIFFISIFYKNWSFINRRRFIPINQSYLAREVVISLLHSNILIRSSSQAYLVAYLVWMNEKSAYLLNSARIFHQTSLETQETKSSYCLLKRKIEYFKSHCNLELAEPTRNGVQLCGTKHFWHFALFIKFDYVSK